MRDMHPPISHCQNEFDVYNFSIISNNFSENVRTKCIVCGEALRIRVENYSKSTKIAITARKLTKFFRESMPPDPLQHFLFLNQLQICSSEKKYALKKYF